jgi:hypothetical protein
MREPAPRWRPPRAFQSFYRIVRSNPPTLADFLSNEAKGRRLQRPTPEAIRRWSGLSAYDTVGQARITALLYPRLGTFIAELHVRVNGTITSERWPDVADGRFTLWGEPEEFLSLVAHVEPVRL